MNTIVLKISNDVWSKGRVTQISQRHLLAHAIGPCTNVSLILENVYDVDILTDLKIKD